jgi:hypothetical protein
MIDSLTWIGTVDSDAALTVMGGFQGDASNKLLPFPESMLPGSIGDELVW